MNYVLNVCIYCLSRICHTYNKNMLLTDSASNQATIETNLATTSPQEERRGGGGKVSGELQYLGTTWQCAVCTDLLHCGSWQQICVQDSI